jgi:type I restriction enzyme S subunit
VSEGSWPVVALGELIESIEAGSSFRCRETSPQEGEVGMAKVSAVSWGRYDEEESKTCLDPSRINDELLIRKGDFLISRANTVELVGACVIAEQVSKKVMLSDKTLRLQFKDPSLKPWVLHFLRSRAGRRQIEALCTGNQESMRNISQRSLRQIELPLAPPAARQAIITFIEQQLSCVQATIHTLEAIQAKLKQARASILKAAVEGRLAGEGIKSGIESTPYSVKEVCLSKPSNGKSVPTGDGFPVLRLTAMKDGRIDKTEAKPGAWTEELAKPYMAMPGDFFVMRGNGSLRRVGDAAIAKDTGIKVAFPDTMIRLQPDPRLCLPEYLLLCWRSPDMRSQIERSARTTAGIYKINQRDISGYRVVLPDLASQRSILQEVDRRFSVLDQVEATVDASLRRCDQLRQAVLKRAFGG